MKQKFVKADTAREGISSSGNQSSLWWWCRNVCVEKAPASQLQDWEPQPAAVGGLALCIGFNSETQLC